MTKKFRLKREAEVLLRAAKRAILANPDSYRQDKWHCGSACCIAGHVCVAAGATPLRLDDEFDDDGKRAIRPVFNMEVIRSSDDPEFAWSDLAQKLMGVRMERIVSLFSPSPREDWPEPFKSEWRDSLTRKAKASIAARRIEHFIQTGK